MAWGAVFNGVNGATLSFVYNVDSDPGAGQYIFSLKSSYGSGSGNVVTRNGFVMAATGVTETGNTSGTYQISGLTPNKTYRLTIIYLD